MKVQFRRAKRAEAPELIRLIVALAKFEKLTPPDAAGRRRLTKDGFGAKAKFEPWLAFCDGEAVGYAILVPLYSSFEARPTLYLEDLFVLPAYRGRGIGQMMMRRCIEMAWKRKCGRMEWTCLDWNVKAQKFYHKLGARKLSEWYLYRLNREQMKYDQD